MAEEDFMELGNVQDMLETNGVPEDSYHPEEVPGYEGALGVDMKEKKWPGWPGENVFRILIPIQRVGGIIGRKGEYIKKTCEETKARIKILDGPPGTTERTVMVSAKEEPDLPIPPALDGLLKIHKRIVDPEVDSTNLPTGRAVCTRLLVAGLQAGSLIGKQGATIKSIQDDSHSTIRVLGGDHLPSFALPDDSVVEIKGEPTSVHKAVELIGGHLRKFLVDRSVIGIFETQMQMPNGQQSQDMLPSLSWGLSPSAFPTNILPSNVYGSNVSFMDHPPQQYDNYHPPVAMPSLDKLPRLGLTNYGHDVSVGAHTTNYEPQQAMVAKVTQNMQIPLVYADRVIGVNGANISYIRRASGATVVIQESRAVPGEMTVEINGSASQIQAAQQLIQNSIAHTISSGQDATGPPGQAYNPYTNPPLVYASSTAIAPTNHTSMYGPGYSYGY